MALLLPKTYVCLFNGPPRSGKDTAAKALYLSVNETTVFERFSMPLKQFWARALGQSINIFGDSTLEAQKDDAAHGAFGRSYRQLQIDLSEDYVKKLYPPDAFGQLLVSRLQAHRSRIPAVDPMLVVIPDSGFIPEAEAVIEAVGSRNVLLFRLHREGCTFAGDSRSHIELPDVSSYDITNDADQVDFERQIKVIVRTWMQQNADRNYK